MKKILVIEDHELMRRNVVTILTMEGYTAISATNGREGLALARSEAPDLILCDILMPELDGHQVLAVLRADPATASQQRLVSSIAPVEKTRRKRSEEIRRISWEI